MNRQHSEQLASAFRLSDRIIVHSNAQAEAGFWVSTEPYFTLDADASAPEIGEALARALSESRTGFSVAKMDMQAVMKPLLRAARVRSWRRFVQQAVCCNITYEPSQGFQIDPTHNGGTRGDSKGFQFRPSRRIVVASEAAAEELGSALLRGFEACTSVYHVDEVDEG